MTVAGLPVHSLVQLLRCGREVYHEFTYDLSRNICGEWLSDCIAMLRVSKPPICKSPRVASFPLVSHPGSSEDLKTCSLCPNGCLLAHPSGHTHRVLTARIHTRPNTAILALRRYYSHTYTPSCDPKYSATKISAWNVGCVLYIFWIGGQCFIQFVDLLIWRESVRNIAPVWCDIS